MSTSFEIHNQWIFVLVISSHLGSSSEVEDCPLMSNSGQYCIKNKDGIVPTISEKNMWITFNRSVVKTYLTLSDLKPGILPIRQIHIGEPNGPILVVYSQSTSWRVGVENKKMQNENNKVSEAFMLIRSTLCIDCCFIMAVNFTQFTLSDNVNKSWNGMLYSSDTDLFVSSEDNKPATISNIVWQMGSDAEYDCHDSSPLEIQGTIQGKASTAGKSMYVEKIFSYCFGF